MYLPVFLTGFGIFLLVVAAALIVLAFVVNPVTLILAAVCLPLGIAALLCQKNQWAVMKDGDTFVYSTMFGNQKEFRFSEMTEVKMHSDSMDLVFKNGKVHVETIAVMTERFSSTLNDAIQRVMQYRQ